MQGPEKPGKQRSHLHTWTILSSDWVKLIIILVLNGNWVTHICAVFHAAVFVASHTFL